MEFTTNLEYAILAITLLASLTLYWQPGSDLYLKLFPPFMLVILISGAYIFTTSKRHENNNFAFISYWTISCCFYFFIFWRIIRNRRVRRALLLAMIGYPIFAAFNLFFLQKVNIVNTFTISIGNLLIVGFSIYYFYELFERPFAGNLMQRPDFWICSGLLFFYACSFSLYAFGNFLRSPSPALLHNIWIINNLLDVLLYSSFTIAFLCRIRITKYLL
jgi:hypothetical protein